ncbi:MAG TPA: hypothetical protein PKL83_03550 [bacterium]|nr:hypothetical protein [bacterium]
MIHINLLPGAAKRKIRQELIKLLSAAFTIFGFTVAGLAVIISLVYSQKLSTASQIRKLDEQIAGEEGKIAAYQEVINETSLLRDKLVVINDILSKYNHWANFLSMLAEATPAEGIKFITISASDTLTMNISGIADSAEKLAALLQSFELAHREVLYEIQPQDTVAKITKLNTVTADQLYYFNNVANEKDLLALRTIIIPKIYFDAVDLTSVNLENDAVSDKEVEKNVIFSLSIAFREDMLR